MKLFILFLLVILLFIGCKKSVEEYDLIIKSGTIVDGTGNPWFYSDIGIKGERILKIGKIASKKGKRIINAKGLYVSPGFIDVHTHVDRNIADYPTVPNYLFQGVTTVVGGNCGGSRYPLRDLFHKLERTGIAINFATFIGHNTIREEVMGKDNRDPTPEELARMKELVRQEMQNGAIGFSTGLSYVPGRYSKTEEIIELVKMIQPFNGIYATHMRNQGKHIKNAIEEAVRIGREAGVTVEISHIKLAHEAVWGKIELITDPIEKARKAGFEVYMDQYPYTATSSGFGSSFPGWAVAGGQNAFLARLKDPEKYKKIKAKFIEKRLTSERGINKLETIYIAHDVNHPQYEGKNLAEILDLLGREKTISNGADLVIEIQKEAQPRGIFFQMDEDDVKSLMQRSYNMIASDGKIEIKGVEVPHPRAYGTFPRVLAKYVRDSGVISLPEAIRKMASLPAQAMGFYDRGVLKAGMYADICVFNLAEIQDLATFENPHQYPKGIRWVIVNGKIASQDGDIIEKNGGKILYGQGKKKN
jgi:N-acyl-D-amino-acid deacylase